MMMRSTQDQRRREAAEDTEGATAVAEGVADTMATLETTIWVHQWSILTPDTREKEGPAMTDIKALQERGQGA